VAAVINRPARFKKNNAALSQVQAAAQLSTYWAIPFCWVSWLEFHYQKLTIFDV
jgi:hypothetical protein